MITTHHDLSVDTCATVRGTCPAKYIIDGTLIEFHFGGDRDGFQFAFDSTALQNLMKLGTEALARLEPPADGHPDTSG